MKQGLEGRISNGNGHELRSAGERRIAGYLDAQGIPYEYERPLLVLDQDKPRIWYPDFYLPELAIYLEYYGLAGQPDYDQSVQHKQGVYRAMKIDVVPLFPSTFRTDWRGYIIDSLQRITERRYRAVKRSRNGYRMARSKYG